MFDNFRYPYAVIYLYRKRGAAFAIDKAVQWAKVNSQTREDAGRWLAYILRSATYKGYEANV